MTTIAWSSSTLSSGRFAIDETTSWIVGTHFKAQRKRRFLEIMCDKPKATFWEQRKTRTWSSYVVSIVWMSYDKIQIEKRSNRKSDRLQKMAFIISWWNPEWLFFCKLPEFRCIFFCINNSLFLFTKKSIQGLECIYKLYGKLLKFT